jgi:hypothetical protein
MDTPEIKSPKPPYLSFTTLSNFLKINKSNMQGQSGTTQSYLLSALEFFGLTDAKTGDPTGDLETLVKAEREMQKAKWREVFLRAYAPVINGLDLQRATADELLKGFREYNYSGDTLRKCHVFFVAAAEAAGIQLSQFLKMVSKVAAVKKSPKKKDDKAGSGEEEEEDGFRGQSNGAADASAHRVASLPLNGDGSRFVMLKAPTTVTSGELKRIQQWLGFQLIVEDAEPS